MALAKVEPFAVEQVSAESGIIAYARLHLCTSLFDAVQPRIARACNVDFFLFNGFK